MMALSTVSTTLATIVCLALAASLVVSDEIAADDDEAGGDAAQASQLSSIPLLQYVGLVESDRDPDGSAAAEICRLHASLASIVISLENVLARKAGGLESCPNIADDNNFATFLVRKRK